MSNVAIISDIHGNYPALRSVIRDINERSISNIVCLGDIVGFYSMVNECIDLLREMNVFSLIGNHDFALLYNNGEISRSKTCTRVLKRQMEQLTLENLNWLKTLKSNGFVSTPLGDAKCVHGGLRDPVDEYLYEITKCYVEKNIFNEKMLLHGHTHIPRYQIVGGKIIINPGSVGQPRDEDVRASYCIISSEGIQFIRVNYDINELESDMLSKGYEQYIVDILRRGVSL